LRRCRAICSPGLDDLDAPLDAGEGNVPALTPREMEVLSALADSASNKVTARRLWNHVPYRQIPRCRHPDEAPRSQMLKYRMVW